MTAWPKDNDQALDAFYGRPDGSAQWEVTHLTYIFPPWKCYLAGTDIELSRGIRVHKKVAAGLERIFNALWETFGKSQAEIEKVDLHQIGGAYYFRARRGSKRLSNHARGIAIDIDPQDNVMKPGNKGDMDKRVIAAFEAEGWRWGGVYGDPMHFEAVDNGKPWTKQPPPGVKYIEKHISKPELSSSIDKPVSVAPLNLFVVNEAALKIIKDEEKFMPNVYSDLGAPAIGYGHRLLPGEKFDKPITEQEAHDLLIKDLRAVWKWLAPLIKVRVNANQTGALLGWAMNNKPPSIRASTLLKMINAADFIGAAAQFRLWIYATVKGKKTKMDGLERRNNKLAALFLTPV